MLKSGRSKIAGNFREVIHEDCPIIVGQYRAVSHCGQEIFTVFNKILELFCELIVVRHKDHPFSAVCS